MIKGSQLVGRAVIDMDAAERLGNIKEVIVQRDGERVAGFVVAKGETILGSGGTRRIVPATALHVIGPDAITVGGEALRQGAPDLDTFPRMSDVIGRKMVTRSGRLLGSIDDVLIDNEDGKIVGFSIGEGVRTRLENIFSAEKQHTTCYVRADADLQVGTELIVVPEDAVVQQEPATLKEASAEKPEKIRTEQQHWGSVSAASSNRRSLWSRRSDGQPDRSAPDARTAAGSGSGMPASAATPGRPTTPGADIASSAEELHSEGPRGFVAPNETSTNASGRADILPDA